MLLNRNPRQPGREVFGENLVALARKGKILFRYPSFFMRGKRQRHLVKTNIYIRMMIAFLSSPCNPVDKGDAF